MKEKRAHLWEQDPHHWYVEPIEATAALLRVEPFDGLCFDPCCGQGNIVSALHAAGLEARGADLIQRVPDGTSWFEGAADFLADPRVPAGVRNIITNPPFYRARGAEAAIRQALALAPNVAAFVDTRFLNGAERAQGLYRDWPPTAIYFITPRVSCPPGTYLAAGGKAGNGTADYAWIVWRAGQPRRPPEWLHLRRAA